LANTVKSATFTLTPRELEVAHLVAQGLTNRQIASRLFIAERTAEYHVEQIRNKLGFHARSEIAAWVVAEQHRYAGIGAETKPAPAPDMAAVPRVQRPRRLAALLVASVIVAIAGVAGIAWALTRPPASLPAAFRVLQVNESTDQLALWSSAISDRASNIAVGESGLWSVSYDDRVLTRINPRTHAVVGSYGLGAPPIGIAVGGGIVWIATAFGDSPLVPFDPKTNRLGQPVSLGSDVAPQGVAYGWDAVWITDKNNNVVDRIDPSTDTVTGRIAVGDGPEGIAIDRQAVWVANGVDRTVSRIDPSSSRVVATIGLPGPPAAIAVGLDAVWVVIESANLLVRIDPVTNAHLDIPIDGHPSSAAVTQSAVWVADGAGGRIVRIDPRQNRVVSSISAGGSVDAIAADGRSLWISVHG
jgi:YVTN family beta-propeller protein